MSGTVKGGQNAATTNKNLYGHDFYKRIGAMGGKNGHTGGFYADRKRASEAGKKGGLASRRTGVPNGPQAIANMRQAQIARRAREAALAIDQRADFSVGFNKPRWTDRLLRRNV